jgi:uncharacterized protein UPF0158
MKIHDPARESPSTLPRTALRVPLEKRHYYEYVFPVRLVGPYPPPEREQYDDLEGMPAAVRLSDIIDALEMQFDEFSSFLDRDTGQVVTVSDVLLQEAEAGDDEEPDLPAWQKQEWGIAKEIVSTNRFQQLPTKFDVHEWAIMQDFSRSIESNRIREDLLHVIHGAGAFRNFKDTVRRHRIESAWFAFRAEALRQIAIDWCEENHIVWE